MKDTAQVVTSFFARLDKLDQIVRIIVSDARLRARFTVRGETERSVLLDLAEVPARTVIDDDSLAFDVQVAMTDSAWHEVLSGRLSPGEALGRREMLLRGSAGHLAYFVPLFDFAPVLYREHERMFAAAQEDSMSDEKLAMRARRLLRGDVVRDKFYAAVNDAAYAMGYGLGKARTRLDKLNLFALLESMSKGIAAADPGHSKGAE